MQQIVGASAAAATCQNADMRAWLPLSTFGCGWLGDWTQGTANCHAHMFMDVLKHICTPFTGAMLQCSITLALQAVALQCTAVLQVSFMYSCSAGHCVDCNPSCFRQQRRPACCCLKSPTWGLHLISLIAWARI